ncbi:hypothetical protein AHAS_AhasUnG0021700 [Arachis hypogaea]
MALGCTRFRAYGSSFKLLCYYVIRTEEKQLRQKILNDGPWVVAGHCIATQRWSPNWNPYNNKLTKIALGIRVPILPMHCYTTPHRRFSDGSG